VAIRPIITALVRLWGMVTSGRGPARNVQARGSRTSAGPQYEDAGGLSRIGGYRVGLGALVEEGSDSREQSCHPWKGLEILMMPCFNVCVFHWAKAFAPSRISKYVEC